MAHTRASLLANATLIEISANDVDDDGRIGLFWEDKAVALGRLMAVDGQRDPIKIVAQPKGKAKPWRLVVGKHRLVGARREGIPVWAIEVSGKPEDLAELEASENLHRRPLAPIERAKFTAALVKAAQDRIAREHGKLKQSQIAVKARWDRVRSGAALAEKALRDEVEDTSANFARVYGWEDSVSEALGMSKRTVHNDLELYRLLIEPFPTDIVEALARHPVVGENASQLRAIAKVRDEKHRRKVIDLLLADPELSVDDARVQAGVDQPSGALPESKQAEVYKSRISDTWERLTLSDQRDYLPRFVGLLTAGQKKDLRDQLNKELGDAG